MLEVLSVAPNSIAEELEIKKGDKILKIDKYSDLHEMDIIFFDAQKKVTLHVLHLNGEVGKYKIVKDEDEKIGLEFVPKQIKLCANNCIFCFVHQLPEGLRKSLYVKDDDVYHSFLYGNYVTLTNVSDNELEKICNFKLSPLYISVHATDDKKRNFLLGRKKSPSILKQLKKLAAAGIILHTQIVMCPNINDGEVLKKTLKDLYKLRKVVATVAVVPVGLSTHREKLYNVESVNKEKANETIDLIENFNKKVKFTFVYPSDEFYLKAERTIPAPEVYGDFSQIENGVGLVSKFENEFNEGLKILKRTKLITPKIIVTGLSFAPTLNKLIENAKEKFGKLPIEIVAAENTVFGKSVTVAGLLCGNCIINALKNRKDLPNVLISATMLRQNKDTFLDDFKLTELEKKLKTKIIVVENDGRKLLEAILKGE